MSKKTPQTLSYAESELLLDQLKDFDENYGNLATRIRNYTMALIMLEAGLRVGELINLRIEQLILSGEPVKSLQIEPTYTKSKTGRLIPLTSKIQKALEKMYDNPWSDFWGPLSSYAFRKPTNNKPLSIRQVERIISNASLKAIGRKVNPHVLRHTFATRLMRQTSMPVVQELLGHENLSSTQIYTHPNGDDLRKAIEGMDGSRPPLSS